MPAGHQTLADRLSSLALSPSSDKPSLTAPEPERCLAHLRLLVAFEKLKARVGFQDGLWDIWDNRASSAGNSIEVVAKLREKRWAVYVARAVDRYESWWKSFGPSMLLEKDMIKGGGTNPERYERFVRSKPLTWKPEMIPPIDVLLVWHAHMLNPRLYLEDSIRYGYASLWAAGVPWKLVNAAVSGNFAYAVSDACKESFKRKTNREWENLDDSMTKEILCPACEATLHIPWTTCGLPEEYDGDRRPGLAGEGFGDGQLDQKCKKCNFALTHDSLRVAKFWNDIEAHTSDNVALPGTIIDAETGLPRLINSKTDDRLFPSQLAKKGVFNDLEDHLEPHAEEKASMGTVRDMAEYITGRVGIEGCEGIEGVAKTLSEKSKEYTEGMMARYWQNSCFAALELCGAVMRLGVFSQEMANIDWINKTASYAIMQRLLIKYTRFMGIMAENPDQIAAPTLDVDLAWHTHQLSPRDYLAYSISITSDDGGRLMDHDDRVDEDRLSVAFEWLCRVYMDEYESPFSECTCWYCESVRTMNEEDILEEWHASGAAAAVPQPPTHRSAHISNHPSVITIESPTQRSLTRPLRQAFDTKLYEAHGKAQGKASRNGPGAASGRGRHRIGPRGEDRFNFWGKPVAIEGPSRSALALATMSVMYATPPGVVECGSGNVVSCRCGTCVGCSGGMVRMEIME